MPQSKHDKVIGILGGTGAQGSALALRWANAGHSIVIGSRSAQKASEVCERIRAQVGHAVIDHGDNAGTAARADIIVLCVPFASQRATVEDVQQHLKGKLLIDATVPLVPPKVARVQLPSGGSAVAAIQALLGDSVKVVSAFQNVAAQSLGNLAANIDCDVLVCGDDIASRETVIKLAADIGVRAIHAGPIVNSAAAEALTSILISINSRYKLHGAGIRITGLDDVRDN